MSTHRSLSKIRSPLSHQEADATHKKTIVMLINNSIKLDEAIE